MKRALEQAVIEEARIDAANFVIELGEEFDPSRHAASAWGGSEVREIAIQIGTSEEDLNAAWELYRQTLAEHSAALLRQAQVTP